MRVPLADGPVLEVREAGTGPKLTARLAPLHLGLTAGVLAGLLIAAQDSSSPATGSGWHPWS